ncbi:MAG: hypothetical protein US52_C0006G0014 [candidate division WS6 bacterium GW2011_GWA2_37_6]|uniref:VCBS repeat-containing protein n=1 Tax=candidate division WS6 bacterium GW2011_GWA2_37_6 TaxID=1619087 RepID=A0A0G0JHE4_9BACT|nr:MAG: hypothetical protein US52_C0006G0014 [candidate division WS6 bacterium GW2011_GWA2_37_6]
MRNKISLFFSVLIMTMVILSSLNPLIVSAEGEKIKKQSTNSIKPHNTESDALSADGYNVKDLIAFNIGTRQIDVTLSNGTNFGGGLGGFQLWNSNSGYNPSVWKLLKPSDVDGDGDVDIIAFNTVNGQINVTLSNGVNFGGGIGGFQVWNSKSGYSNAWTLLDPADVNGDLMADIIAYNPTTRQIDVTLSNGVNFGGGRGGFQVWNLNSGYNAPNWQLLSPADVNGDYLADIIAFNKVTRQIDVTPSTGINFGGGIGGYEVWNTNTGYNPSLWILLAPADVDGDEIADLFAWNKTNGQINVTLSYGYNFGGGRAGSIPVIVNSGYLCTPGYACNWKFLDPADVNGDSFADIIVSNGTRVYVTGTDSSDTEIWFTATELWNLNTGYTPTKWILLD